ncbi:MAG: radical SAM protein [Candidatus Omnitrophica bacterium]|nr:radical SAM protein [Candidatus Omnitrophota bacterium]
MTNQILSDKKERQILRKTEGVCEHCGNRVDAFMVKIGEDIFFEKHCPEHGICCVRIAFSKYYEGLEKFYFSITEKKEYCSVEMVELVVSFSCNMNCPVCYLGDFTKTLKDYNPTLQEIERFLKTTQHRALVISGAEATCREDLCDIIKLLKSYGKTVSLNTNGIKLTDFEYVSRLKNAGLDRVNMQFTGFSSEAEITLRGNDYIEKKLQALENLRKLNVSTGLNVLIAGGLNDSQIGRIIEFAAKNKNIKMVNLSTMIFVGNTKDYPRSYYLMPDDIIQFVEDQTKQSIKPNNVYIFKKLEIVISSFLNKNTCLYHQGYVLVRKDGGIRPIDYYVDLGKIEPYLDKYQKLYLRNIVLAKLYLLSVSLLIAIRHVKIFKAAGELVRYFGSYFFNRDYFLNPTSLMTLVFSVECDYLRKDYTMYGKNCPCKAVFFAKYSNGKIVTDSSAHEDTYWFLWRKKKTKT